MSDLSVAEKAEKSLRMVEEAKLISYDTETSGVDWKRNFPIGYIVAVDTESFYVPVRHGGGGNLPDVNVKVPTESNSKYVQHKFEKQLAKSFEKRREDPNKLTVGHNMKFDAHFSANANIFLGRNISCTMNREALIDEHAKSYSLENCALRHGITAKKGAKMYEHLAQTFSVPNTKSIMGKFWMLPGDDEIVIDYAEGDGVSTYQLWLKQQQLIKEEKLETVDQMEADLVWTLFRMERKGIKIDVEYLAEALVKIDNDNKELLDSFPEGFNPRSPKSMKLYCENAGQTDWPLTEKGNPSFTGKFLETFPEGQKVVDLRKMTNLANSFMRPLMEEHSFKGRVHASLNQNKGDNYGTISGRFSCSGPNLQQVPKHDKKLAELIRRAFMADENMRFYELDWSQAEPRLFAHYSGESALVDGYNETPPRDMHTVVAELLKVDRATTGKRMNMGILTGMYPKTFAIHMSMPLDKATKMWNLWFSMFPKIKNFQDKAKQVILRRGFVRTLLGRRCRMDNPRFSYKATSRIIQGGSADLMKYKLLEIDKWLENHGDVGQLLMTVHDSVVFQTPDTEEGRSIAEEIKRIMEDVKSEPFNLRVPFVADANDGATWADASRS